MHSIVAKNKKLNKKKNLILFDLGSTQSTHRDYKIVRTWVSNTCIMCVQRLEVNILLP